MIKVYSREAQDIREEKEKFRKYSVLEVIHNIHFSVEWRESTRLVHLKTLMHDEWETIETSLSSHDECPSSPFGIHTSSTTIASMSFEGKAHRRYLKAISLQRYTVRLLC